VNEPPRDPTWIESERRMARLVARPLRRFLDTEVAGGVVLLAATLLALVIANSPLQDRYFDLLHTVITVEVGSFRISEDILHWVNDGLMAIFFFVVGLEIKRELVRGELSDRKKAALPVAAALGGMVVPALIYAIFNAGSEGSSGWGIPMATDIAFAVGVLALVMPRAPSSLKVFLLSLAIADDIGAIIVIAIFYAEQIDFGWLLTAGGLVAAIVLLRAVRVWWIPIYVAVGILVWVAVLKSGVHATIAGVILGLITPVRPLMPGQWLRIPLISREEDEEEVGAEDAHVTKRKVDLASSVAERLEYALHPWSSYLIIPIFAFVNAGIVLTSETVSSSLTSTVSIGVVVGLVLGKLIGITLFTRLAMRLGLGDLPGDMRFDQVVGIAALAGIGFTVSIFISSLAFTDPGLIAEAKIGILVASLIAGVVGGVLLRRGASRPS
jgi:Na+:H+ antiporter, NhaA family